MKKLFLFALAWVMLSALSAHPWKPKYYTIVDTDCGFDDLRALSLMLASPEIRILAITTSNGVVDAKAGYLKVKALLNDMHHEGLLVGASSDTEVRAADCIQALNFEWGNPVTNTARIPTAVEVVDYVLSQTVEPVTFVSLGSLHTADKCMHNCRQFSQRINRIVWSSQSPFSTAGFNYTLDTIAFKELVGQPIPLYMVSSENRDIRYDPVMSDRIAEVGGQSASLIASSILYPDTLFSKVLYDELAVLYMHFSDMFTLDSLAASLLQCSLKTQITSTDIMDDFEKILTGATVNQSQVLSVFPLDTASYFSDVNAGMTDAIEKYGKEEWIANTLAGELHRHLGVYAVMGVKMGLRTKEYFGAGIDELTVISYAGTNPPYSCMNDGIQVSTGATLGHGLIRISPDTLILPCAEFTYLGQTVRVTLKEEYHQRIEQEINEYNRLYGLNSNIYWELVRIAAIKYWINWDRNDIFDILPLSH